MRWVCLVYAVISIAHVWLRKDAEGMILAVLYLFLAVIYMVHHRGTTERPPTVGGGVDPHVGASLPPHGSAALPPLPPTVAARSSSKEGKGAASEVAPYGARKLIACRPLRSRSRQFLRLSSSDCEACVSSWRQKTRWPAQPECVIANSEPLAHAYVRMLRQLLQIAGDASRAGWDILGRLHP